MDIVSSVGLILFVIGMSITITASCVGLALDTRQR